MDAAALSAPVMWTRPMTSSSPPTTTFATRIHVFAWPSAEKKSPTWDRPGIAFCGSPELTGLDSDVM